MSALLERLRKDEAQFISALDLIELIAQKNNIPKHEATKILILAMNYGPESSRPEAFGLNTATLQRLDKEHFLRFQFNAVIQGYTKESKWWEDEIPF